MIREPEWDAEQRAWAMQHHYYETALHSACGGHPMRTTDPSLGRIVEKSKPRELCLDCKAIDDARAKHHEQNRHTKTDCDCHEWAFYVASYVPRDQTKSQPLRR